MRTSARRVHGHVSRALQVASEREWRALLADGRWDLTGGDVGSRSMAVVRRRHRHHAVTALVLGTTLTLAAGVLTAVVRTVMALPAPPPTANVDGLLPWAP